MDSNRVQEGEQIAVNNRPRRVKGPWPPKSDTTEPSDTSGRPGGTSDNTIKLDDKEEDTGGKGNDPEAV
ncbi:hypothetical protein HJFPF1_10730 [Paramyrothecium foliicola]|nr:hypothetical protein HJFPF1_10730 [Paramyrothecium foliicola]